MFLSIACNTRGFLLPPNPWSWEPGGGFSGSLYHLAWGGCSCIFMRLAGHEEVQSWRCRPGLTPGTPSKCSCSAFPTSRLSDSPAQHLGTSKEGRAMPLTCLGQVGPPPPHSLSVLPSPRTSVPVPSLRAVGRPAVFCQVPAACSLRSLYASHPRRLTSRTGPPNTSTSTHRASSGGRCPLPTCWPGAASLSRSP